MRIIRKNRRLSFSLNLGKPMHQSFIEEICQELASKSVHSPVELFFFVDNCYKIAHATTMTGKRIAEKLIDRARANATSPEHELGLFCMEVGQS